MNVQWYPGHMTKTRRMIAANLKLVDLVVEIIDARIPISSRNPDLDELLGGKPRLIILNRADQADPAMNKTWSNYLRSDGASVLQTDCKTGAQKSKCQSAKTIQEIHNNFPPYEITSTYSVSILTGSKGLPPSS